MNVAVAEYIPIVPIWSASTDNFYWRGVLSSADWILILSFPKYEFLPIHVTTIFPVPSMTFEEEIRNGFTWILLD